MDITAYLSNHPKKHLIFDFDRTLITLEMDWNPYCQEIANAVLPLLDENLKHKLLNLDISMTSYVVFSTFNEVLTKSGDKLRNSIREAIAVYENKHLTGYTKNQELIDFVKSNKDTYSYDIWSNNALPTIQKALETTSLSHLFLKIACVSTVNFFKPIPSGFHHIWNPVFPKTDYLMIGDGKTDKVAAQNAGIDFYNIN